MAVKTKLSCLFLVAVSVCGGFGTGCGSGSQEIDANYMATGEEIGKARRKAFDSVKGDYSQLSGAAKEEYLKTFNGDEVQAQRFWDFMKNPPTSPYGSGIPVQGGQ